MLLCHYVRCNIPIDIDECKSDTDNICDEVEHSRCINTEGSYICDCEMGFTEDKNTTTCTSIVTLLLTYVLSADCLVHICV